MPDAPTTTAASTTEPTAEPTEPTTTEPTQGDPADLGDAGKKAIAAEREARKAAEQREAALAAKVKAFEDAQKTDAEKAAEALAEAQKQAATAATEALRWRTAAKHGISDEDAETFLTGTDEATITRQAERLAELQKQQSNPAGPRPDLSQGPKGEPPSSDPAKAFADAFEGRI